MDQKHAMLYPPIEPGAHAMANASAAMGLPTEAPPSYDMAMMTPGTSSAGAGAPVAALPAMGWTPSAPIVGEFGLPAQASFPHNDPTTSSVIVVQPTPQPQRPQQQLPYQHRQQQQDYPQELPTGTSPLPTKLGPNPCAVVCPACGSCKTTRMSYTPNSRTHMVALVLCLVGWCCCACCVPYCMNSCRTGNHYCAKCNTFLGTFNPREGK